MQFTGPTADNAAAVRYHSSLAGSASSVNAALQESAALLEMAIGSAGTNAADTSSDTTGNTTSQAAVTEKLAALQNMLLTTLTTVMDTKDPAAMGASLNAADAVSGVGHGLSAEAGAALLDVVVGFVSANKDAKSKPVSDEQVRAA